MSASELERSRPGARDGARAPTDDGRRARVVRIPDWAGDGRAHLVLVSVLAVLVVGWAAFILAGHARFALAAPEGQAGAEAAGAMARLFGALVLIVFPRQAPHLRLRWVAAGLLVIGTAGLLFGSALPLAGIALGLETRLYAALVVWTVANGCFVVGLLPASPPELSTPRLLVVSGLLTAALAATVGVADRLPALVRADGDEIAALAGTAIRPGLTNWHWGLGVVPLVLATTAVVGAAHRVATDDAVGWLLPATVLLAGSQLHNLFWPSAYDPILTTANFLRLAFAAAVATGGVLELRRAAAEHGDLLRSEQEVSRRMAELAALRADFTAMIAHELASPVAAIRALADALAADDLPPDGRVEGAAAIRREADLMRTLVADVGTVATAERDDFVVYPFPIDAALILAEAAAYARTLPHAHPCTIPLNVRERVCADPERIAQVLRNLLSNAAKYADPGAPIAVRVARNGDRLRFEVVDRGHGIPPEDLGRIFERFGRGRDLQGRRIPGMGLGLYLSRRILLAHGTDLTVWSTPGEGSVFAFDLEITW
jgi:signal transduction histidine kinase